MLVKAPQTSGPLSPGFCHGRSRAARGEEHHLDGSVLSAQALYEIKPGQLWTHCGKRCHFRVLPKGSPQSSQNKLGYFPST